MALLKAKKTELIASYADALKGSKSLVYVTFKKLPVGKTSVFRKGLFAEKTHYTVVKKTLWGIACKQTGVTGTIPEVAQELAVVWGDDLLTPARLAHEFGKANKESFTIMGGIFDGVYKSKVEMLQIATIPPREILLSQLAYLLASPMQRLAIGLSAVADKKA